MPAEAARSWRGRGFDLPLDQRTLIMGILNVTPDSFSDGGRFSAIDAALAQAQAMTDEGADIVDVGGESTRPGSAPVDAEEEAERVLPIIRMIAPLIGVPISIDTYKAEVAAAAIEAGAVIVNDVWGMQRDEEMAHVVAANDAAIVLMHNRERADADIDIMEDVRVFLARSIDRALSAGIKADRIMLDPGVGFGKVAQQSMEVIRRLGEIRALGFPVLLGASRKSFIGGLTGVAEPRDRLCGTLGAHLCGVFAGAEVIRAHDVAAHREALVVADAIRGRIS